MKNLLIVLFAGASLVACGSSGGGGKKKMRPLTEAQLSTLKAVAASAALGQSVAAEKAQGNSGSGRLDHLFDGLDGKASPNQKAEMEKALDEGQCSYRVELPDEDDYSGGPQGSTFNFDSLVEVSGSECPVRMKNAVSGRGSVSESSMQLRFSFANEYRVTSPKYQSLNDVTLSSMAGDLSISGNPNKGIKISGSMNGQLFSQENGAVKSSMSISGSANQKSAKIVMALTYKFSDFTAQGKMVLAGSPQSEEELTPKYYINDREVSEEEFGAAFGFGMTAASEILGGGEDSGDEGFSLNHDSSSKLIRGLFRH